MASSNVDDKLKKIQKIKRQAIKKQIRFLHL